MRMWITAAVVVAFCTVFLLADEASNNETNETAQNDAPASEESENADTEVSLEDIDVLCSKNSSDGELLWTWLDVADMNVRGHWRGYSVCSGKDGVQGRFRFAAFILQDPASYTTLQDQCRQNGYDNAQPAKLYPERPVISFGWPDRGYVGVNGPPSHHLGSGRPDSIYDRRLQLAYDGWYVFHLAEEDVFTAGFLTVDSCRRIEPMEQFQIDRVDCSEYQTCV